MTLWDLLTASYLQRSEQITFMLPPNPPISSSPQVDSGAVLAYWLPASSLEISPVAGDWLSCVCVCGKGLILHRGRPDPLQCCVLPQSPLTPCAP
ncbi:hypothetical protein GDO86_013883 [Hymenochirus boettgeri]|uniref:Uncharacterized protein n=1 Tax=Hymenochirus boettgeri TaxID=247094 RepID=A0A8T2JQW4_9PIPI|nr:hypothetical protein GDO86_013883 [Hymenochirus boettgeri]